MSKEAVGRMYLAARLAAFQRVKGYFVGKYGRIRWGNEVENPDEYLFLHYSDILPRVCAARPHDTDLAKLVQEYLEAKEQHAAVKGEQE